MDGFDALVDLVAAGGVMVLCGAGLSTDSPGFPGTKQKCRSCRVQPLH
jgi:hypothetical protein